MPLDLVVSALNQKRTHGVAKIGTLSFACGLGRTGLTHFKREGDGATPIGRWPIQQVFYRADRAEYTLPRRFAAHSRALSRQDGWCDAVGDPNYNRHVTHPYHASAERMWRDDGLYDIVVVLRHNQTPRIQGAGSAIFLHCAKLDQDGGILPTAGCVSLKFRDLKIALDHLSPGSAVAVLG